MSPRFEAATGGRNAIYLLCESFEPTLPRCPAEEGCLALKHIDANAENIGQELRDQLYEFRSSLDTDDSMAEHVRRHGIMRTLRIGFTLWPGEFRSYLARQARLMTERRTIVKQATFFRAVFNIEPWEYRCGKEPNQVADYQRFNTYLYEVIGEEEKRQRLVLPNSNTSAMRMDTDIWKVFWVKADGTSLQSNECDFSDIKNPHFKAAFKYWLKEKKWRNKKDSFRGATFTGMISRAFNFLSEEAGVAMPSAVTVTHVRRLVQYLCVDACSFKGEPLAMASVRGHFKVLNQMFDWLMRADVTVPDGQAPVVKNAFRSVSFKNENDHTDSADYIPEEVVMQLLLHQVELPTEVGHCLAIMMELGLRYQDAVMLEEGCLSYDDDMGMHVLRYIPMKVRKHRMKKGLSVYHEVGVKDLSVVRAIQEQEIESAAFRRQTGTKLIFVKKSSSVTTKVNVLSATGFVNPIRMLISKHNITDHDGNLWFFNSHQCRKTVAVVMVENKAKPVEIRQFLGHLDQKTTDGIYAEVRKLRQGELNHEFFEKKFKATVPEVQLAKFSEEERRILYTEFALGQRNVELGVCIKHASEGPCGKRTGQISCATCKSICTGPQFEPKWQKLVDDAECDVAELEAAYHKKGILESEYVEYREYQKASRLLKEYRAGLAKINSYGDAGGYDA